MLRGDVGIMFVFDEFHMFASIPHSFASYSMNLIPKIKNPYMLSDFRHISLAGSLYKLLAKVLAKRLGVVMEKLISLNQSDFLKGRMLIDGIMAVNELVD